jgi:hypothetical protein
MFISGINDTGDKLFGGVNDTADKFIGGFVDLCNLGKGEISASEETMFFTGPTRAAQSGQKSLAPA